MSRTYNSPLREQQMEQTRDRILEHVQDILATGDAAELTVAEAAARAGVAVRTAYRYFPTREALIDGFNTWMTKQLGSVPFFTTLDGVPDYMAGLFRGFAANEQLIRAGRKSAFGGDMRARRKKSQAELTIRVIREAAPHLSAEVVKQRAGSLLAAFGSDVWLLLRDQGLDPEECIATTRWSLETLIAQLHHDDRAAAKAKRTREG